MNITSLPEALDFSWNHEGDVLYFLQNNHLSFAEQIVKKINDCIVYLFASILGVNSLEKIAEKRIPEKINEEYREYVNSNSHMPLRNQSVILILYGEKDVPMTPENFAELEKQSKFKIKFVKISKLNDIKSAVDSLKNDFNTIEALWIRAHGTPVSIGFARDAEIKIANVTPFDEPVRNAEIRRLHIFLEEQLNQLEANAPIILESCFTGQERKDQAQNIAEFIASAAGGRKVFAPSREALPIDKNISYKDQRFDVNIKSFQSSSPLFAKGSCLARMSAVWHAFRNHEVNITREFTHQSTLL